MEILSLQSVRTEEMCSVSLPQPFVFITSVVSVSGNSLMMICLSFSAKPYFLSYHPEPVGSGARMHLLLLFVCFFICI